MDTWPLSRLMRIPGTLSCTLFFWSSFFLFQNFALPELTSSSLTLQNFDPHFIQPVKLLDSVWALHLVVLTQNFLQKAMVITELQGFNSAAFQRIIYHDKVQFIPRMQRWFNIRKSVDMVHHINRMNEKEPTLSSQHIEKGFEKISFHVKHFSMLKPLSKVGIEGNFLNMIKVIYEESIYGYIILGMKLFF